MKIAAELAQALERRRLQGGSGAPINRMLAQGPGWTVEDVVCTSGPADRPFAEQHEYVAIAIVTAGTFHYRAGSGRELMTPGSLMLGNAGQIFECGHEHGAGDRCISFRYSRDLFENLARPMGRRTRGVTFGALRVPPLRELSSVVARASAGLAQGRADWQALSVEVAGLALQASQGELAAREDMPASTLARVTRVVRRIENEGEDKLSLAALAQEARLSPYHFLRVFMQVSGLTPHQYVRRLRLRQAAATLAAKAGKVLDIAFDSGFGDVSNFNHAFRAEFGMSPRQFRQAAFR